MSFAKEIIRSPQNLIYPIVHNNTAAVAENLTEIDYPLTMSGYMNVLNTMWQAGKKKRVLEILNVAYIDNTGPDFLADYMAQYADTNDTVVMTYEKHAARAEAAKRTEATTVPSDTTTNVTIATAVIILLAIFIYYVK